MSAIKHSSEVYPGRVLYHVYGVNAKQATDNDISKYIITSKPAAGTDVGLSYVPHFFNHICEFKDEGEVKSYRTDSSLGDCGIFDLDGKRTPHNLNRLFPSFADAQKYVKELQTGDFSDPVDREYVKSDSNRFIEENKAMMDWWFEEPISNIPEDFEDCEYIP